LTAPVFDSLVDNLEGELQGQASLLSAAAEKELRSAS
jgi:hypothetical protein